jgi:hypothetical protein
VKEESKTVIEMNIDTYRGLRSEGTRAVYDDANQKEVLVQAVIADTGSLILSTSGATGTIEAIRAAREKGIHVISRADYLSQAKSLRSAGAGSSERAK